MKKKKNGTTLVGMLLLAIALGTALAAEPPNAAPPVQPAASEPVDVEVFEGVQIRHGPNGNIYPKDEVADGREGWVVINTMVDPQGKPYEAMIMGSSGNRAFEKAALRALNQVGFEPARRGGTAIDSSVTFKMIFAIDDPAKGATEHFVSVYRRFMKAVVAGDRAKADAQLGDLKAQNLYEEAFANLALFNYHRQWGTPAEQLKDLRGAIAGEKKPTYLPKDTFTTALGEKFRLEVQAREYGEALETWDTLAPLAPAATRKQVQPIVDQLRALQLGDEPFRHTALINDYGSWSGTLFRKRFSIAVTNGSVNEIKLRCAQKYLIFKYDPSLTYSIGTKGDRCSIEVMGDSGTKFDLVQ